jgi:small subunit ribosomal protein S9
MPAKTEKSKPEEKPGMLLTVGKRKKAVARARFRPGKGIIRINSLPLGMTENELMRLRLQEPLMIAGEAWRGFDIRVNVRGGGSMGQADAARQAIARGLVELLGGNLRQRYMAYDRNLLVFDPRRTEPHKPPRSSQGPRRYKQRSKR